MERDAVLWTCTSRTSAGSACSTTRSRWRSRSTPGSRPTATSRRRSNFAGAHRGQVVADLRPPLGPPRSARVKAALFPSSMTSTSRIPRAVPRRVRGVGYSRRRAFLVTAPFLSTQCLTHGPWVPDAATIDAYCTHSRTGMNWGPISELLLQTAPSAGSQVSRGTRCAAARRRGSRPAGARRDRSEPSPTETRVSTGGATTMVSTGTNPWAARTRWEMPDGRTDRSSPPATARGGHASGIR